MEMISLGLDTEIISSALHNSLGCWDSWALDMIKFMFTLKYVRLQPSNIVNPQSRDCRNITENISVSQLPKMIKVTKMV